MANATPTQKQNKRAAVRSSERAAVAVPVVFCYHGAEVRIVLRLYSVKKTEKIIRAYSPWIEELSARYGIPAACIKAMLRKEVADIDILDPIADTLVWLNYLRDDVRQALYRRGLVKTETSRRRNGALGKRDSSTGWAQIFAFVAVNAGNYALEHGLDTADVLGLPASRESMWRRLRRDKKFNLRMGALNLLAAGEVVNGHTDFSRYTSEDYMRMFTRYNADTRTITPYGREVYRFYEQFLSDPEDQR